MGNNVNGERGRKRKKIELINIAMNNRMKQMEDIYSWNVKMDLIKGERWNE